MAFGPAPLCAYCKHLSKNSKTITCDAFPDGIPDDILDSRYDHTTPHAGDHDIVFENDGSMTPEIIDLRDQAGLPVPR